MNNNIILNSEKLNEIKGQYKGDFVEVEKTTSIIANSLKVYEDRSSAIIDKSIFESEKEFNSIITHIDDKMKAIISALNNLNISNHISIEINNIDLDANPDPNDLCDYYSDEELL